MSIVIRPYQPTDEAAIENITYRTGFKGEGLEGRDYFNDKQLFYLIFIAYYARFEPENFFVAVDVSIQNIDGKPSQASLAAGPPEPPVVGFICGTTNTTRQERRFTLSMIWRIFLRAFLVTSWQSPKTMKTLLGLARVLPEMRKQPEISDDLNSEYPAHLHINVLPEFQHSGIGTQLIRHFEDHLRCLGIRGVHLETSSRNHKAIPFYLKQGYAIVKEAPITSHPIFDELRFLTFAKALTR